MREDRLEVQIAHDVFQGTIPPRADRDAERSAQRGQLREAHKKLEHQVRPDYLAGRINCINALSRKLPSTPAGYSTRSALDAAHWPISFFDEM